MNQDNIIPWPGNGYAPNMAGIVASMRASINSGGLRALANIETPDGIDGAVAKIEWLASAGGYAKPTIHVHYETRMIDADSFGAEAAPWAIRVVVNQAEAK